MTDRAHVGRSGHRNLNVFAHFVVESDRDAAGVLGRIFDDAVTDEAEKMVWVEGRRRGHDGPVTITVLEREMYSEAEAARLLRVSQSTLHYWLEGGDRQGRRYEPILRVQPSGERSVTWGEFVEASVLREYRRTHGVPMVELRRLIEMLRDELCIPYPLAALRPFVGEGRRLLVKLQEQAHLDAEFWLATVAGGQPLLTHPAESFVSRVEWEDDVVVAWRPHAEPDSPVRMRPDVRFGLPAVSGIRTEVVWEHLDADETFEDVADQFDLSVDEVHWAHAYETALRATPAA